MSQFNLRSVPLMTNADFSDEIKYQNSLLDAKESELDLWEKQLDQKAVEIQQLQDKVSMAFDQRAKEDILAKSKEKYYELIDRLKKIIEYKRGQSKDECTVTFDFIYEIENAIKELKQICK